MYNKVLLLGRLTKDVEVRTTPNGKNVASCSIATSKTWKDENGNKQEKVEFTNLVIWKGAEVFAQYLSKGSKVFIEGELATRDWVDKNTGQKRYSTEVIVNDFKFLDNKKSEEQGESIKYNTGIREVELENGGTEEISISDIPFN